MKNADVRDAIRTSGIKYWQVAEALEISDGNFSRMLRREMNDEKKAIVFAAINKAMEEKENAR